MAQTIAIQFDRALPYAPDWGQLVPLGHIQVRDGRQFLNDSPEKVL